VVGRRDRSWRSRLISRSKFRYFCSARTFHDTREIRRRS
jgi:hypothetical protein